MRKINEQREERIKLNYLRLEMYSYPYAKKALENNYYDLKTPQIMHISNLISKIELALEILGGERREVIEDMYFNHIDLNYDGLALKHYVHLNTIRYWEKQFFDILSNLLGIDKSF